MRNVFSKEEVYRIIEEHADREIRAGRALFDCPETGFQEYRTEELICERLAENNIPFERGIARTGVRAQIGHGAYHIGIVADMDALPRRDGTGCIHSCGHSIQTANALTLLEALSPFAQSPAFDGRVSVFFTPAEELTDPEYRKELIKKGEVLAASGKQHMIAAGLFDDVDCILSCHASADPAQTFNINSVLTGFLTKRVIFHGKAAHSGAAPHLGRNALSGAVLSEQAIALLKDQFAPEEGVCIHPVIRDVNGGINIIPDRAVLETYIRARTQGALRNAAEKFDRCVISCAQALELTADVQTAPGYLPLNQNRDLNKISFAVMRELVPEKQILQDPISGASGDIGDLGTLIPSIQFGFSGIRGCFHTDDFAVEDETFCYVTAAKVLAGIVCTLLTRPECRVKNTGYPAKKENYLRDWLGLSRTDADQTGRSS